MSDEIERKFLIDDDAEVPGLGERATAIRQGYVAVAAGGDEVRVRERAGRCVLTVKHGSGLVRGEQEAELSPVLFEALWALTEGRRIEKVRHLVDVSGGLTAEVDVFGGALAGLRVVEVEFADADAAAAFTPPPWFGEDVTGDDGFRNQALALR